MPTVLSAYMFWGQFKNYRNKQNTYIRIRKGRVEVFVTDNEEKDWRIWHSQDVE